MKVPAFDAVLDVPLGGAGADLRAEAVFLGGRVKARIMDYGLPGRKKRPFVRVLMDRPLDVRWADPFEVRTPAGDLAGRGRCLYPNAPSVKDLKPSRRKALLDRLGLGEREMVLALTEAGGVQGLKGEDLETFCRLSRSRVEALSRALEEEGLVRILGFDPLRLVSQASLDFLRARIASFLARHHKAHPGRRGAAIEVLEKKLAAPRTVLVLALRLLAKEGRTVEDGGYVHLSDFQIPLSPADEKTLVELEGMVLSGEFGRVRLDDIRATLKLTSAKLQTLLAVLAERKKIVEGVGEFILHATWLDEIVRKVRESGKRELTVADFKAMTGLSRKYSIPLLELLDSMGVTRRKGSVRDIL